MPLHLKKKMKLEKNKLRTFEIMPPSGSLLAGQKINIQIKFMPTEEVKMKYNDFFNHIESLYPNLILQDIKMAG